MAHAYRGLRQDGGEKWATWLSRILNFVVRGWLSERGCSLQAKVFGEAGPHARSAVGVAELPLGAPVKVEVILQVR